MNPSTYEVLEHGQGRPLIMLHGMMGHPKNWRGVFPYLPGDCHAMALCFPFFQEGVELDSVPAVLAYAEKFLDSRGLDSVVLCGNSLGGHVSLDIAIGWPNRVRGLILAGSSGLFERGFTVVGSHPDRAWIQDKVREVFYDSVHASEELVNELQQTLAVRRNVRDLVRIAKSAKRDHVGERLKQVSCPVLLIWGRQDQITPPDVAEEFHRGLPNSELAWVDQCGHAPMMERPREFGELVSQWWQRHMSSAGPTAAAPAGQEGTQERDVSLVGRAMRVWTNRLDGWLRRAAADPVGAQQRQFQWLLGRAAGTWFGRKHGFSSIRTHADFVKAVPIRDFVADLDVFRRIEAGEPDVCWPGRTRHFAQTSGTTAGDKHIPVTRKMAFTNRRAAAAIFAFYGRWEPKNVETVFSGRLLFMGGSTALARTERGALIGDLSGIAAQWIPWPITRSYEPGRELASLDNWEQKVAGVAERLCRRDVRFVTGMPSWVKILFDRVCQLRGFDPVGGISKAWPNLRLVVHGGVNFAPYRPGFLRYFAFGHKLDLQEVYPASEGFIAIQAEQGQPGMEMLTDNGLFYEFVPLDQWGRPGAPRLTIDQVELNVPYSLVISTCAGLWAYDLGDVVRFVSLRPPRIVFAGRNKLFLNAYGENLISEQIATAIGAACAATGAQVREFTVGPEYASPTRRTGTHRYVVEFSVPPPNGTTPFVEAIDAELRRVNNDYATKRRGDLGMTMPELTAVSEGAFYRWMGKRGQLGSQHKVPVCANDRRFVDELLATDTR